MLGKGSTEALKLGQLGSTFINNTSANTGDWGAIQCVSSAAATFSTLTSGVNDNGDDVMEPGASVANLNGMTIQPGQIIFGRFSDITLGAGAVIAYKI